MNDPLYDVKMEHKQCREELSALEQELEHLIERENDNDLELRHRYRKLIEKHIETYNKEYKIKFVHDTDLANQ